MSLLTSILKIFFDALGGAFADVAKDVLKTPAVEKSVTEVRGCLDVVPSSDNNILNDYSGVLNRS